MEASGSRRPKNLRIREAKIQADPRGHKTYGSGWQETFRIRNTGFLLVIVLLITSTEKNNSIEVIASQHFFMFCQSKQLPGMKKIYYIFVFYINFLFSICKAEKNVSFHYTQLGAYRISLALLKADNVGITGFNLP